MGYDVDGVKTSTYQITDIENYVTLGTFCHENGHMLLGYPDLYDYGGESSGTGRYCLMSSSGSTNPIMLNPYFRYKSGWYTLDDLTDTEGVNTHSLVSNSSSSYVFANKNDNDEFFIMESRQDSGRSSSLPRDGMIIWHVDTGGSNNNEQMTPSSHYHVSVVQADGDYDLENGRNTGDSEDLFRSGYRDEFSDYTPADANWWSGEASGFVIRNISASGSTMSFETQQTGLMLDFVTPLNNAVYRLGEDSLNVEVSVAGEDDAISPIANVTLYLNDSAVSQIDSAPYQWNSSTDAALSSLSVGTHELKAVGTHENGMTTITMCQIVVLAPTVVDLTQTSYWSLRRRALFSMLMSTLTLLSSAMPTLISM